MYYHVPFSKQLLRLLVATLKRGRVRARARQQELNRMRIDRFTGRFGGLPACQGKGPGVHYHVSHYYRSKIKTAWSRRVKFFGGNLPR